MRTICFLVIICSVLSANIKAQVKNVNIAGSFDAIFVISGTSEPYKINGLTYLTESWIYGTIELKEEIPGKSIDADEGNARQRQNAELISKCNELIQQISDPDYQTIALKLIMADITQSKKDQITDVEISKTDFNEVQGFIKEFENKLLTFLTELRTEYESELTENNKVNGLLRYNLYAQEFEMITNKDTLAIRAPLDIQSITLSNKKFIYGFYVDRELGHDYLGSSYFEVLNEGDCKLLIRHAVNIKNNSGPVAYNWAGDGSDSFVKSRKLYYQKMDGTEVKPLKKSKRNLKKIFTGKYDEIEKFIRGEKINVKNEDELIKVFTYFNNLES